MPIPLPPSALTSSAACSTEDSASGLVIREVRPVMYTVAPASPRPSAHPLPTPQLPPVTTAILVASVFIVYPTLIVGARLGAPQAHCKRSQGEPSRAPTQRLLTQIGVLRQIVT